MLYRAGSNTFLSALILIGASSLRAQTRTGDDSIAVARERAMWDAITKGDSAAYVRVTGPGMMTIVTPNGGVGTASKEKAIQKESAPCEPQRVDIDSLSIEHPRATMVLVAYRARVEWRCTGAARMPPTMDVMSVWVQRSGRWALTGQSTTYPED